MKRTSKPVPKPKPKDSPPIGEAPYDRLLGLEVTDGFLDGLELQFGDGLNCLIGGRGPSKSTVLELTTRRNDR